MALIDFHSHVLPGIDDGSPDVQTSIAMLRLQAEQGITHVVATPHFYPDRDRPELFLQRRDRAEEKLRREMAKYNDLPQVIMGAEVYFFRGISHCEALPLLTLGKKDCIMIEMPPPVWGDAAYRELWQIHGHFGLTPVIAHVDRYIAPWHTHRIPEKLKQLPVVVQANASFFLEKRTAGMALRMLQAGKIQLLGSDCHNLTDRSPNLGQAVQVVRNRAGEAYLQHIQDCGCELLRL